MSEQKTQTENYNATAPAIMTFPALFVPRKVKRRKPDGTTVETGEPKYEANFLFEPTSPDFLAMKAIAVRFARAHGIEDLGTIGFPFKSGTKEADKRKAKGKDDGEFARDKIVMIARSGEKYPPKLTVIENGKMLDLDSEEQKTKYKGQFYSGVKVWFQVSLAWYDPVGDNAKAGITARLNVVVSTNKGDRVGGGGQSGSALFSQYLGQTTTENPTVGDDDIPF